MVVDNESTFKCNAGYLREPVGVQYISNVAVAFIVTSGNVYVTTTSNLQGEITASISQGYIQTEGVERF